MAVLVLPCLSAYILAPRLVRSTRAYVDLSVNQQAAGQVPADNVVKASAGWRRSRTQRSRLHGGNQQHDSARGAHC